MGKHVVVGAGQVGSPLARTLHEHGHDVRLVSRSGSGPDELHRVSADATDPEALARVARGADALYNCVNPQYHRWPQDWPPIADSLLRTAETVGAGYVILGNLYVYAPPTGPMRSDAPLAPPSRKAGVRAEMWHAALTAHEDGRIRATEVRAGDYFGPECRDFSFVSRLFLPRLMAGKRVWHLGDPAQPHSWTYVRDVVRALAAAGTGERAWGRPWHVPTAPALSVEELVGRLCDLAGVERVEVSRIPHPMLRAAGLFSSEMREMEHILYQWMRPFVMDSTDFEQAFGLAPTPIGEALSATLAAWRDRESVGA